MGMARSPQGWAWDAVRGPLSHAYGDGECALDSLRACSWRKCGEP
jgi:hypothetical protein